MSLMLDLFLSLPSMMSNTIQQAEVDRTCHCLYIMYEFVYNLMLTDRSYHDVRGVSTLVPCTGEARLDDLP
jgi:hypothetical protein